LLFVKKKTQQIHHLKTRICLSDLKQFFIVDEKVNIRCNLVQCAHRQKG